MGRDLNGKELGRGFSQRKDGRYEARAVICGTKIDIYDMNLAKLKKEFEAEKARVLRDEKNVRPNVTFGEWYQEWFEKCKSPQLKSDVSRKTYDRKVRNTYCKILGEKRMENISQMNVQAATTELIEKGYTDRSVREALGIVNECMEIAIVNHIINVNPCVGIKIQNANERKERRVMKQWEQDLFLNEVKDRYYYEAYKILLLTGMRIGDADGKISLNQQKPSKHAGLRRFGPEKFLQRNNEFMKERPIFYKKPIKTEKDFSTWLRCFYYTTKAVITEYIYF